MFEEVFDTVLLARDRVIVAAGHDLVRLDAQFVATRRARVFLDHATDFHRGLLGRSGDGFESFGIEGLGKRDGLALASAVS